ncbi:MAG TPA: DNA methyltransferase [Caproiciproducens sp.]|nr:DNA methyltransferase [Caproiciproducens sp.]
MEYIEFLKSKMDIAPDSGFEISPDEVSPAAKPHQRDSVVWAIRGGRRALFEAFGLGKTLQELEFCRIIIKHKGGKALIIIPLGVRQEFTRDAVDLLGLDPPPYVRNMAEVRAATGNILLTNYERVRDGDIDPKYFTAVALDEAAVLRSFGSKTYQTFLPKFKGVPYKLVATATPAPNRYKELIHYAGFLEIMDTGQALTRFFKRDSTKANNLTLYPGKEDEFWLWVSSWALYISKPSDLGYDDTGYDLPPMQVIYHELKSDSGLTCDKDGQMKLFQDASVSLVDAHRVKRDSIGARVQEAADIIKRSPSEHFILWHDLEDERRELEKTFPSVGYHYWHEYRDGNKKGLELYERHYSAYHYADGRERKLFCGPGEKVVLMTQKQDALFVWRKFIDDSGQKGINCAVFRNEGKIRSSDLIREAMAIAWERWPGERLYTYVNPEKIESPNPGYCFKMAGWKGCGRTKGGLVILEVCKRDVNLTAAIGHRGLCSIFGTQDLDVREKNTIDFSEGKIKYLATKKELSGSGCNFQKYCHRAIFVGIDYEFEDFIQAIHRIYRFMQPKQVIIDIIYMDTEAEVLAVLKRKWKQYDEMTAKMEEIVRKYGLSGTSIRQKLERHLGVKRVQVKGEHFTAINNDCILELKNMESDSVGLIHTSIPFSNHYEYTATYNDFGHNPDTEAFFKQMDYLTPELLRVLKPGRIAAIHVKDRVLFGNATGTGMPTIEPFHALCIKHYMDNGFQYCGMITVVTDVVRENNQTYRLGWTENCKDGSKMGVGCPEYILLFRKLPSDTSKAYADQPVVKSKDDYTRAQWQIDAHAFWRSSGDRLLTKSELMSMPTGRLQAAYHKYSRTAVYDYSEHVEMAKKLDDEGRLPGSFMVVAPGSWDMTVWDDILRFNTLNKDQHLKKRELHVCPLQLDIVKRIINRYSNPDDVVLDPFGGLMTVPYVAVKMGRYGIGIELSADYFRDGVGYLKSAEAVIDQPTLFDFISQNSGSEQKEGA